MTAAQAAQATPPTASFEVSPAAPHTLEKVTFTSTSTGDISSQSWDLDGAGGCNDATGPTAEWTYPEAGTYRVGLCVAGPDGDSAQARPVVIANQTPVASLLMLPRSPGIGETVSFVSTSTDADGTIAHLAWDLNGDGSFDDGTDTKASRSFSLPGEYPVSLRVTDSDGAHVTVTRTVSVLPRLLSPFPTIALAGVVIGDGIRIDELTVKAPPGARVRIRCRGSGCPGAAAAGLRRFTRFERTLGVGAVLEVFVTKPGRVGKYTRFKVRDGRPPARRDLCLVPGKQRPRKCPRS